MTWEEATKVAGDGVEGGEQEGGRRVNEEIGRGALEIGGHFAVLSAGGQLGVDMLVDKAIMAGS